MREHLFAALAVRDLARTSPYLNVQNHDQMGRPKSKDPEELLSRNLIVRVTERTWKKLDNLQKTGDCPSIAEVARRILANRQVKILHKDISMNTSMEEMALIRKELKAIGININQLTRRFNQSSNDTQKAFYIIKAEAEYKIVGERVDRLLSLISKLAEKWLQG